MLGGHDASMRPVSHCALAIRPLRPATKQRQSENMTGTTRSSADLDPRRKRLLYRSWHRGTREMDLILGSFADRFIADLDAKEIDEYEALMEAPDPTVYKWISGEVETPANYDTATLRRIRTFHEGGTLRHIDRR